MNINIFAVYNDFLDSVTVEVGTLDMSHTPSWMKIGEAEIDAPIFDKDEFKARHIAVMREQKLAEIEKIKASL